MDPHPTRMANFKLEDYAPVQDRVQEFYQDFPDGCIQTEIKHMNGPEVIIEARVYRNRQDVIEGVWVSDLAREVEGKSNVNKTSHVENCFAGETEILTEDGWRRIDELVAERYEGQVASLNLSTDMIRFARALHWITRNDSLLIEIEDSLTKQRVTPDHRVLVGLEFVTAQEVATAVLEERAWELGTLPTAVFDGDSGSWTVMSRPMAYMGPAVRLIPGDVRTYCLTTVDGTVVTRLDGKVTISGQCATSAIGRALAAMGYATSASRPSRSEMIRVARMQQEHADALDAIREGGKRLAKDAPDTRATIEGAEVVLIEFVRANWTRIEEQFRLALEVEAAITTALGTGASTAV